MRLAQRSAGQAQDHPLGGRDPLVGDGGEHHGNAVTHNHRTHEGAERRDPRIGVTWIHQQVAARQDDRDELHAVYEPVECHGGERQPRRATARQIAHRIHEVHSGLLDLGPKR